MIDIVIIGLGNPGKEYDQNMHNVGFLILNHICHKHGIKFFFNKKIDGEIVKFEYDNKQVVLLKPMTFMNSSGVCVQKFIQYYKLETKKIIVIYDDIDIDFRKIKCKLGGSSGGHNGIKSIDKQIGNDYFRIRIGISRPKKIGSKCVADYVLSNFSQEQLETILEIANMLYDNFSSLLKLDLNYIDNTIKHIAKELE